MADSVEIEGEEPSNEECEEAIRMFAEITATDEALAHFFLQDTKWKLQPALDRFFGTGSEPDGSNEDNREEVIVVAKENGNKKPRADVDDVKKTNKATAKPTKGISVIFSTTDSAPGKPSSSVAASGKSVAKNLKRRVIINDASEASTSAKVPRLTGAVAPLKLLSWNVDGLDPRNLEMRCISVCYVISEAAADVVFLQEVTHEVAEMLKEMLGGEYRAILLSCPRELYFTAILLKHSVNYIKQNCIPFPNTDMGRTMHTVEAKFNGMQLKLLNTHLESMRENSETRSEQLQLCFTMAREWDDGNTFVLLGGDLNIRDHEVGDIPEGFRDAWIEAGMNSKDRFTWDARTNNNIENAGNARCRFDRIFYKSGPNYSSVSFELVGKRCLKSSQCHPSDHFGILTTFT